MKKLLIVFSLLAFSLSSYARNYTCTYDPSTNQNFVEGFSPEVPIVVSYKQGFILSVIIDHVNVAYLNGDQEVSERIPCETIEGAVGVAHYCEASEESLLDDIQIIGVSDVVYFSTKKIPNIAQDLSCESSLF